MSDTLILNRDANPLSVVPLSAVTWQVAIRLAYQKKVHVIHTYDSWVVRSPSVHMFVPAVVVTSDYIKWNRQVKYNRTNIFLRDDFTCQFCGAQPHANQLTLDHVIPRAHGGKTNWTNIVTACKECNHGKGNNKKIVPKKAPVKPGYYELISKRMAYPVVVRHKSWLSFIQWPESLIQFKPPRNEITSEEEDIID